MPDEELEDSTNPQTLHKDSAFIIIYLLEFWAEPSMLLAFPIWYCHMVASLQDPTYIYSCIYAVSTSSICPNTTGAKTDPLLLLLHCQDFQHYLCHKLAYCHSLAT